MLEKKPLLPLPTHSHTTKVVLTLVDYLQDKGHDLYTDRFIPVWNWQTNTQRWDFQLLAPSKRTESFFLPK